ncbi:MAG: DUF2062 domain-containing protein [Lautropia sp.]
MQWLGPRLMHQRLWRPSRRTVAIGGAVGVFFGLLIPVAQIPVAAGVAMVLRVNLPGLLGLSILAVSGAVMTYIVITLGWHFVVFISRRRRRDNAIGVD